MSFKCKIHTGFHKLSVKNKQTKKNSVIIFMSFTCTGNVLDILGYIKHINIEEKKEFRAQER